MRNYVNALSVMLEALPVCYIGLSIKIIILSLGKRQVLGQRVVPQTAADSTNIVTT